MKRNSERFSYFAHEQYRRKLTEAETLEFKIQTGLETDYHKTLNDYRYILSSQRTAALNYIAKLTAQYDKLQKGTK